MLSKLIRYEWKAVARVCIPMYGGLILAAMLTHFLLGNLERFSSTLYDIITMAMSTLCFGLFMAAFVLTLIIQIQRFSKNLLGDEGYLMFTLPASVSQHITAKLVVAVLLVIKWIDPFAPGERPLPETLDWITVELLPLNEFSRPGTPLEEVNGIVIHYVGNPGTTAAQNHSFFTNLAQTGETYASSHFLVGLDGEVLQNVPLNEVAYCSNQRNDDTISIECCHPDDSGEFTSATYESLVRLTRWLMEEYGLDTSQVIRHYDVTGKLCPKAFVERPEAWEQFQADLKK